MADQESQTTDSANSSNGTHAAPAAPQSPGPDDDDLLGELARAMHHAATSQYERMTAELERRRTYELAAIESRAGAAIESLKAASEADIGAIDAWAKSEADKVKLERLRRIDARREQLANELLHRESLKGREVSAIEAALGAHREEVDGFFGLLERETDPAAIARIASTPPVFPPLGEIAEEAGRTRAVGETDPAAGEDTQLEPVAASIESDPAAAVTESRLMAVMHPEASVSPEAPRPWEAPHAVTVTAGTTPADPATPAEPASRVGSTLLRTVRAIRPMSGERHDPSDHR